MPAATLDGVPFTLSHAAAVLPAARRPLVPSALVAGAMAPDVTLFASFGPSYPVTHSIGAVFGWDVLLAIIMLAVWYGVLREPLLALVPVCVSRRVPPRRRWRWLDLFWIPMSASLGAASHVFWDSFTHHRSIAIWGWQWLNARLMGGLTVFDALQYLSSVAGLVAIVWWGLRRPMLSTVALPSHRIPSRNVVLVAVAVVASGCSIVYGLAALPSGLWGMAHGAVVGATTGTVLMLVGYAVAWRVRMALQE